MARIWAATSPCVHRKCFMSKTFAFFPRHLFGGKRRAGNGKTSEKKHRPTSSRCGSRVSEVVQPHVPGGVTKWHRKRNSPVVHRVLKKPQWNNHDWPKAKGFGRRLEASLFGTFGSLSSTPMLSAEATVTVDTTSFSTLFSGVSEKPERTAMPGM